MEPHVYIYMQECMGHFVYIYNNAMHIYMYTPVVFQSISIMYMYVIQSSIPVHTNTSKY